MKRRRGSTRSWRRRRSHSATRTRVRAPLSAPFLVLHELGEQKHTLREELDRLERGERLYGLAPCDLDGLIISSPTPIDRQLLAGQVNQPVMAYACFMVCSPFQPLLLVA